MKFPTLAVTWLDLQMTSRLPWNGSLSSGAAVKKIFFSCVRQWSVLAHVLFKINVQYVTRLLHQILGDTGGAYVSYRLDRSLFALKKLKANTNTQKAKL